MHGFYIYIATVWKNNGQVEPGNTNHIINSDAFTPLMSTLMSTLLNLAMQQSLGHCVDLEGGIPPKNQSSQVNSSFTTHSHVRSSVIVLVQCYTCVCN